METAKIREDLKDIRYYYSRKAMFEKASASVQDFMICMCHYILKIIHKNHFRINSVIRLSIFQNLIANL